MRREISIDGVHGASIYRITHRSRERRRYSHRSRSAGPSRRFMRTIVGILAVLVAVVEARAACNLIPSASKTCRGALGDVNRPFAAPGDFVEVGASPARCAGTSPGFSEVAGNQIVTVVFKPPGNGTRRVAFVTPLDCNG